MFFESIGRPVPMYYNPADHFLEVLDEARRFNESQIGLKDAVHSDKGNLGYTDIKTLCKNQVNIRLGLDRTEI